MATALTKDPARSAELPAPDPDQEELMFELANLPHPSDWEQLIEAGTTPALIVGGERRVRGNR